MWLFAAALLWAVASSSRRGLTRPVPSNQLDDPVTDDAYSWPLLPPPSGLWTPTFLDTPLFGNYVYLETGGDNTTTGGNTYVYTESEVSVTLDYDEISVDVFEISNYIGWNGYFQVWNLGRGFYGNCSSYPAIYPLNGISWYSTWEGYDSQTGWLFIEEITYVDMNLASLELVFELWNQNMTLALRGKVNWHANIPTPHGPIYPPPFYLWRPMKWRIPSHGSFIYLESEKGDIIGGGQQYTYVPQDDEITIKVMLNYLVIIVNGMQQWSADFIPMESLNEVEVGYYGNITNLNLLSPTGSLYWDDWSEDATCDSVIGWFAVDAIAYENYTPTLLTLRFEQHCNGATPALYGMIHWDVSSPVSPSKPVYPPPRGLWAPAADSIPSSGNFIYLESCYYYSYNYTYSPVSAMMSVEAIGNSLIVNVAGDESWVGNITVMSSLTSFELGYYAGLKSYSIIPQRGSMVWSRNGEEINYDIGWLVVDRVKYTSTGLSLIVFRFEQQFKGDTSDFLRGMIYWNTSDPITPPGPVYPPPSNLWQPSTTSLPSNPVFMYFESQQDEQMGYEYEFTYTPDNATIVVSANANYFSIEVNSTHSWKGEFQTMASQDTLELGYYDELQYYPYFNPAKGGMSWWRDGMTCYSPSSWLVIDALTYDNGTLTSITLRFEQSAYYNAAALRGLIQWNATSPSNPQYPMFPPPSNLWKPDSLPESGNWVYLESEVGDCIGEGQNYTYTLENALLDVSANGLIINMYVSGDQFWSAWFEGMYTISNFQPGYYGGLTATRDGSKGDMYWDQSNQQFHSLAGWFVIESVSYSGSEITSFELRFEQHCDGASASLHGAVHWNVSNPNTPSGPVYPPPSTLWSPSVILPEGNFIYLESDAGDYVAHGINYTYTSFDAIVTLTYNTAWLDVFIQSDEDWEGMFTPMYGLANIEVGYYGNISYYNSYNPVKGGMSWGVANCIESYKLTGWFAVDEFTFTGSNVTLLTLRFEQLVSGASGALRGMIRWNSSDLSSPGPVYPPPCDLWTAPSTYLTETDDFVYVEELNRSITYMMNNSTIEVYWYQNQLGVRVYTPYLWSCIFQTMNVLHTLKPGYYANVTSSVSYARGSMRCMYEVSSGWFVIDELVLTNEGVAAVTIRFEIQNTNETSTKWGMIHWNASSPGNPSEPIFPPPPNLWKPAAGVTPDESTFVYLESEPGDSLGGGMNFTYTTDNTKIAVALDGIHLIVELTCAEQWEGDFVGMDALSVLEPGYYSELLGYPYYIPGFGGVGWQSGYNDCFNLTGWFVIDSISFTYSTLAALSLRFEVHCNDTAALHGLIEWNVTDPIGPSHPIFPPPTNLWTPVMRSIPVNENIVYLESKQGDEIGLGMNFLYSPENARLSVSDNSISFSISVTGNEQWNGSFEAMSSLDAFEVGYYQHLLLIGNNYPQIGGLSWSGQGKVCELATGWFVVDKVSYSGKSLTAITMRFEQNCNSANASLHGFVQWNVNNPGTPGPQFPPPSDLWLPPIDIIPTNGDFIYLESEEGEVIGEGQNYSYTQDNATIYFNEGESTVAIWVYGENDWSGKFQAMFTLNQLTPGYYGDLKGLPNINIAKGGMYWNQSSSSFCEITGWFVVDNITYTNECLSAITMRFEQHCNGTSPALHGFVQLNSSSISDPPGPVNPPPSNIWKPTPDSYPASGSFVYLESDNEDPIGQGHRSVLTAEANLIDVFVLGKSLWVQVNGEEWSGFFEIMSSLYELELGYYAGLPSTYSDGFYVTGAISWIRQEAVCPLSTGWFAIDSLSMSNSTLSAITLRFGQHCNKASPTLHGLLSWNASATPPGPVSPPPSTLWQAPEYISIGETLVYMESDDMKWIGSKHNILYTSQNASISVTLEDISLTVNCNLGWDNGWYGTFQGPSSLSTLELGYYGALPIEGMVESEKGSVFWGSGSMCSSGIGWFVVDEITFVDGSLAWISLRFGEYCNVNPSGIHGLIQWSSQKDDRIQVSTN